MTVINHKSISGITSITAPAGSDNLFTVHTNDTTERFRIDASGHQNISGIITAANFKTGTTNVHSVGVEAAAINVLGADTPIGTGATIYNSGAAVFTGVVTATSFVGSGANLTGITQTTINNNANNRIITGSGTANTLEAEATLLWDGTDKLSVYDASSYPTLKFECKTGGGSYEWARFIGGGSGLRIANTNFSANASGDELILGTTNNSRGITIASGNSSGNSGNIFFADSGSNTAGRISYEQDNDELVFYTGTAERTRITASGVITKYDTRNVSIRTASGSTRGHLQSNGNGIDLQSWVNSNGFITFSTNGGTNERLRITSDGDMGLGANNPGADPAIGNDATVFEIRQTTSGNITSGNNRKGAVLRLKHEAQWENGYQSSSPNDDLGRVEFVTGDNSTGEGVRSVIRCRNLNYFNSQALTFEVATANSASLEERARITSNGSLGIGTITPDAMCDNRPGLHIHSNHNDSCRINLTTPTKSNTRLGYFGLNRFGIDFVNGFQLRESSASYATRLLIDNNGLVGLNGLTASDYYSNYNQLVIGRTNDSSGMTVVSKNDSSGYIAFADGTSGDAQYRGRIFYSHGADSFHFRAAGSSTDHLRIDSNGRIRTDGGTQVSDFDVTRSHSSITDVMLVKGNVGNSFIRFQDNDNSCNWTLGGDDGAGLGANGFILYDRVNSAYRWSVDNSGNMKVWNGNLENPNGKLLVGTTSTSSQLTLSSGSSTNAVSIRNTTGGNGVVGILFSTQDHSGGREKAAIFHQETHGQAHYGGDLVFALNSATGSATQVSVSDRRARLTRHGDWMVGTDNSGVGNNANEGQGTVMKGNGQIVCRRDSTMFTAKSLATGGYTAFRVMSAQTQVGSITFNSGGTSYHTSSDYRRKENIVAITDGITKVKQLKTYRFNFKDNPSETVDGFLAHEAQEVIPHAVQGTKDDVATAEDVTAEKAASVGDPIYQQMDQSKLVPLLTAALQEAIAKIETLETEVAALKGS